MVIMMSNVVSVVDQIAEIDAKISELKDKKEELRKVLVDDMGPGEYKGTYHRALVYEVGKSVSVKWKNVAEHFQNYKKFADVLEKNSTTKKATRALKITGL